MGRRSPCCDKSHVKKGQWTAEEDAKILAYVASHGVGNWTLAPQKAGLNRCGKSCRLRWTNYLRPDLNHNSFTPHEEQLILSYHQAIGSRWSVIAKYLPGRTDNDVKNHWNTKLKKKLSKMGIDPITHKPFDQLLSDYGNINSNNVIAQNTTSSHQRQHEPAHSSRAERSSDVINAFQEQQAKMNLVTAHFQVINEAASCSSASPLSSAASNVEVNLPSSPFIWSDYLVGDEEHECTNEPDSGILPAIGENTNEVNHMRNSLDVATTCVSFVESILEQDREMQLEFPLILDGYSEY